MQTGNFATNPGDLKTTEGDANFFCESSVKFATGTVPVGGTMTQPPPFGYTLFPNQGHDESIDYQGGADSLRFLQFIGCVAYIDQFKTVHWTRFCMQRRPGDTAKVPTLDFCSLYNDTDDRERSKDKAAPTGHRATIVPAPNEVAMLPLQILLTALGAFLGALLSILASIAIEYQRKPKLQLTNREPAA